MSVKERKQRQRKNDMSDRLNNIAVIDFETDPFDDKNPEAKIHPFLAVLYSKNFDPIIIWDENNERFIAKVMQSISDLPGTYTIYAHNGGKFDYMFFINYVRGRVNFKGRGIMACKIGQHELRDSFHILPERLANWRKDDFDYTKLYKHRRNKYRDEIITYCLNDCMYLLEFVQKFLDECGLKISIGQAAMYYMKQHYKVQNLGELSDAYLRQWYFGGRVECLQGRGRFVGKYKLYDVNSMYPYVMATREHPIGNSFLRRKGKPSEKTVFLDLECDNYGSALVGRGENGEITTNIPRGRFLTTIWEYDVARKYQLISNVNIIDCLDWDERSDFSKFVVPMYEKRQKVKEYMATLEEDSARWLEAKKDDLLTKYLLNNAYGKYAQNPRNFREHYITDPGEKPESDQHGDWGLLPSFRGNGYDIWERPSPGNRYYNVATAASITGAARAVLLEAIHLADNPIYCDTDSLICYALPMRVSVSELGAWKLEKEFSEVLIAGKKLYATRDLKGKEKVKSKGASGLTWKDIETIIGGEVVEVRNSAPTMTKRGDQYYIKRRIRATTPVIRKNKYVDQRENQFGIRA